MNSDWPKIVEVARAAQSHIDRKVHSPGTVEGNVKRTRGAGSATIRDMGETVRFSELMKAAGKPEIYLPLSDPKLDRNFIKAAREDRVLSIKQEPTGTKKDFGTVGFVPEKYLTYLVFSKPLTEFKEKRVVGIKYDMLSDAPFSTPARSEAPRRSIKAKPKARPKRPAAAHG